MLEVKTAEVGVEQVRSLWWMVNCSGFVDDGIQRKLRMR